MTTETAQDLREGGSWSLAQHAKNDVIYALARAALWGARGAGRDALVALRARARRVRPRGRVAAAESRAAQRAHRVPRRGRGATSRASSRAAFTNLGENLGHAVAALDAPPPLLPFDEASRAVLREALAEGRGVVLPSAHLGPWERLAATLVGAGFPLTAIVRESYDPRFDRIVDSAPRARRRRDHRARRSRCRDAHRPHAPLGWRPRHSDGPSHARRIRHRPPARGKRADPRRPRAHRASHGRARRGLDRRTQRRRFSR